jgi:hypothetical protein
VVVVLVEQQEAVGAALELLILAVVAVALVGLVVAQQAAQALLSFVTPDHSAVQAARSRLQTAIRSIHLLRQEHTHHDYY